MFFTQPIHQFKKTGFKAGIVCPCLDMVDINSRRLEDIGQQPELMALEGGKLPGTALDVLYDSMDERSLKFNVAMKERKRKKVGKKERKKG